MPMQMTDASARLLRDAFSLCLVPYFDRGREVGLKVYADAEHGSGYLCHELGPLVFADRDEAAQFVLLHHPGDPPCGWQDCL